MPVKVNCRCFRNGMCDQPEAPKNLFGRATCILWQQADPRIERCAMQVPFERPTVVLAPPPPPRRA